MAFLTDLNDNPEDGRKGGRLEEPLVYYSERYKITITVPVGYYSDYGTVPWWVPPGILPRGAQFRPAYYVHDYLYDNPSILPKGKVDVVLRDAMYEILPNWRKKVRSWIAWAGVSLNIKRWIWWEK